MTINRRSFIVSSALLAACSSKQPVDNASHELFYCPPCGCGRDGHKLVSPGLCPDPHCNMVLHPLKQHELGFEPSSLAPAAGVFKIAGGQGREDDPIEVHYYMPISFTADSPILLVIPGAGRNSDAYRNMWIETAQQHGVLVVSLGYPESGYDFAAYNMANTITDLELVDVQVRQSGHGQVISLEDSNINFKPNSNSSAWLFEDFERVFDHIVQITGSNQQQYDIFGHSAGAQISHRMALLQSESRARNIVAANAGFYTMPDLQTPMPTGLSGLGMEMELLRRSFNKPLWLLLGENDNSDQAGGRFLKTPRVDLQGGGRLQRGQHFYQAAKKMADELNTQLAWQLHTVPGVGHDGYKMSRAASSFLYPQS